MLPDLYLSIQQMVRTLSQQCLCLCTVCQPQGLYQTLQNIKNHLKKSCSAHLHASPVASGSGLPSSPPAPNDTDFDNVSSMVKHLCTTIPIFHDPDSDESNHQLDIDSKLELFDDDCDSFAGDLGYNDQFLSDPGDTVRPEPGNFHDLSDASDSDNNTHIFDIPCDGI